MKAQLYCLAIAAVLSASAAAKAQTPAPLTVAAAVDYAIENNPSLQAVRQDPAMATARLQMARAAGRLSISANAYGTAGTGDMIVPGASPIMPQNYMRAQTGRQGALNGMAMLPLFTGGRVDAEVRQKTGELKSAQELIRAAENDLAFRVRTDYRKVLLAQELVAVYQQRLDEVTERLRVDQAKYDVGKIPLVFLLRDKTELADAKQSLTNARRDVEIAFFELKSEMGAPLATNTVLADKLSYEPRTDDAEALIKAALAKRPEIVAAQARITANQEAIAAARSSYRPQVGLTAMGDVMHSSNMGSSGEYLVGVVASVPLADGGMRAAQVREAQARLKQAERELDAQRLMVEKDVRMSLANLAAADQNVRTSMEAVAQMEEDHRIAKLRYDAGKGILLEVLDSLTALTRAKVNYSQALYDYSVAQDDLARATGQK